LLASDTKSYTFFGSGRSLDSRYGLSVCDRQREEWESDPRRPLVQSPFWGRLSMALGLFVAGIAVLFLFLVGGLKEMSTSNNRGTTRLQQTEPGTSGAQPAFSV